MSEGATVVAHDPTAMDEFRRHHDGRAALVGDPDVALQDADASFLHTEWRGYQIPDFGRIKPARGRPLRLDGRKGGSTYGLEGLGFEYDGVGVRGCA